MRATPKDTRAESLAKTNVFITKNQEARRNLGPRAAALSLCEDAGHYTGSEEELRREERQGRVHCVFAINETLLY